MSCWYQNKFFSMHFTCVGMQLCIHMYFDQSRFILAYDVYMSAFPIFLVADRTSMWQYLCDMFLNPSVYPVEYDLLNYIVVGILFLKRSLLVSCLGTSCKWIGRTRISKVKIVRYEILYEFTLVMIRLRFINYDLKGFYVRR